MRNRRRDFPPSVPEDDVVTLAINAVYRQAKELSYRQADELMLANARLHGRTPPENFTFHYVAAKGLTKPPYLQTVLPVHPDFTAEVSFFKEQYEELEREINNVAAFLNRCLLLCWDDLETVLPSAVSAAMRPYRFLFDRNAAKTPESLETFIQLNDRPLTALQERMVNNLLEIV